jgi:amidase
VLLTDLCHHVEEAEPSALQDESLVGVFGALWAAQTRAGVLMVERWLGRAVGPDDVEPLTWALAERAKALSADEYVAALAAIATYRRAVHQWWADGWDLLLTPTLGDLPPELGEMAQDADNPYTPFVRAGQLAVFTPAFNTTGQPAISLPTHWSSAGLPVGVQLVAAYGREDVLLRAAAQLEEAVDWAARRPADIVGATIGGTMP